MLHKHDPLGTMPAQSNLAAISAVLRHLQLYWAHGGFILRRMRLITPDNGSGQNIVATVAKSHGEATPHSAGCFLYNPSNCLLWFPSRVPEAIQRRVLLQPVYPFRCVGFAIKVTQGKIRKIRDSHRINLCRCFNTGQSENRSKPSISPVRAFRGDGDGQSAIGLIGIAKRWRFDRESHSPSMRWSRFATSKAIT